MNQQDWPVYYQTLKDLKAQAESALQSGDVDAASRFALDLLANNTDQTSWNYGNGIHAGNQILGLAALQKGEVKAAKGYLLAAGRTPGSPQLDFFGPTMTLAQALLVLGERDTVLEYLNLVGRFWASFKPMDGLKEKLFFGWLVFRNRRQLHQWRSAILAGEIPTLNRVPEPP